MKALPCRNPNCRGVPESPGAAALPGGGVHVVGQPSRFPLRYACAACKRPTTLSAREWAQLPTLSVEELRGLGLLERYARDWQGAGLTPAQAEDMLAGGIPGPSSLPAEVA